MNEMIELAGGKNIFASESGWITVSEEQVIAADPAVIFTSVNYLPDAVDEILNRPTLASLTAVKEKHVYQIDTDSSNQANEYIIIALEEMAKAMYPELWPN
jgi:iron complex transport system substrate-binding protein